MSVLPQNLNYNFIKPTGFPCNFRQERFTPIAFSTAGSGVSSSDVVRFNISSDGYWDPYSAYLKIEVDVSGMDGNKNSGVAYASVGSQQLDNSAQSFINQLIIQKDGTELERIEEYDVLSALLNDIHGSNDNRATRYQEGMSGQQLNHGNQYNNQLYQCAALGTTSVQSQVLVGYNPMQTVQYGTAGINFQSANYAINTGQDAQAVVNRYEYVLATHDCKLSLQATNQVFSSENGQIFSSVGGMCNTNGTLSGYRQPFCPQLSSYGSEPLLSRNIPQFTTYKGQVGQVIYGDRMTFCIPILSGLLGVLMPQESYKFIPMKALQDLIIEFRLNPHALFTSGYADQTVNNQNVLAMGSSSNPMLSRSFKITKFELNVEMQYFKQDIDNIILSRFNTDQGIILHTQSYQLGPRYPIPANTNANGTFQVNSKFESLKTVLFCFIPDDYLTYSFCRKQYRLSQNITQMYIKLGNEYYPPLPVTGHAGTCSVYSQLNNDVDANNTEFLCQLYSAFGKINDINSGSIINSINFAVNQRPYNPANTASLWNDDTNKYSNLDTTVSHPLFHENRCVGRACYGLNLETLQNDNSLLSGYRTKLITPYEITLKSDQTNPYPRPVTMFIFQNYDLLIQINKDGVTLHK